MPESAEAAERRAVPARVEILAAAKLNLALHVTGRRRDGYHLLDSLVVFADVGDVVAARPAAATRLALDGPEADGAPHGPGNLVLRAAELLDPAVPAEISLTKRLPVAAGIGGGSADAAATLLALARLGRRSLPAADRVLGLGADVPVCLDGRPSRMRGIGERLSLLPPLPPLWAVLANPRRSVATAEVFSALAERRNPPLPETLPRWRDARDLADWLAAQRNDLEPPARRICPAVDRTLSRLSALQDAVLTRMSGSGATGFALFADEAAAVRGAATLRRAEPDWWCVAARLGDAPGREDR